MSKSKRRSAASTTARTTDWRKSLGLHPGFPLNRHPAGYWCKRVRGKLEYFGKMADDPKGEAALLEWERVKSYLMAGKPRPPKDDGRLTVAALCNQFVTSKDRQLEAGELSQRSRDEYFAAAQRVVKHFGGQSIVAEVTAAEFERLRAGFTKTLGPVALGNAIQRVRTIFKFAYDNGLIDRPVRYGQAFKKPSRRTLRLARAEKGAKLFEAAAVRRMLASADVHLRAMIYLGLNCGFGNSDCGTLPLAAVDLDGGWVNYHRRKTGIQRRCPLWPQTVRALRRSLTKRPKVKADDADGLFFITKYGNSWGKEIADNPVAKEFRKLLDALKLHRRGLGFYTLRHCFRTAADSGGDQVAANAIMGHVDDSMAAVYRERIDDERLLKVVQHVRQWLTKGRKAVKRG